jgi:hypothetical protein
VRVGQIKLAWMKHARSIETAWAYLGRGGDEVDKDALVKLGGALFQYLLEHGEISPAMSEKIFGIERMK